MLQEEKVEPKIRGTMAVLNLTLGPQEIGCVVQERKR
jgi:hypothetical protein